MSLFGSLMGDFDDDLFMGNHMNAMNMQMRSMNRLMNSLMPDPFNMLAPFNPGFQQNALMERANPHANQMGGLFGFPAMPNMNRLLSADIGSPNGGASFCSSSVITMSSGADGRPQIYQATTSTKTGPGGIRETRKTVEDSRRGLKKMAIGHHIGERSHIIEKEQDLRSGQLEERQEFINLDEEEAEQFDREFTNRARMNRPQEILTIEDGDDEDGQRPRRHKYGSGGQHRRQMPALPAPPSTQNNSFVSSNANATINNADNTINTKYLSTTTPSTLRRNRSKYTGITSRRPLRTPPSSPLTTTPTHHCYSTAATTSVHPHPYNPSAARRNFRPKHTKQHQQPHQSQLTITEIIDDDEPTVINDDDESTPTVVEEPAATEDSESQR